MAIALATQMDGLFRRYESLPDTDRRAVTALGILLVLCVLFLVARWSFDYRSHQIAQLEQNRSLMLLLSTNERKIKTARNSAKNIEGADKPLLTLVSATAKDSHIAFKRFQPDGEGSVKLWMEHIEFNNLLFWLHRIERKNGILIQEISVEQAKEEGYVDVRLTLQR